MSNQDHFSTATPGPWTSKSFDESQTVIYGPEYDGGKRELVAIVSVGRGCPNGEGNARLIAAAPTLLAALKVALEQTDDGLHSAPCGEPDCWVEDAIAAIAAAEGEAGR